MKVIELICCFCKNGFSRPLKDYKYESKKAGPEYKVFCSRDCHSKYNVLELECAFCKKIIKKTVGQLKKIKKNVFCSSNCSALFNNKDRAENGYTTKNKKFKSTCMRCFEEVDITIHCPKESIYCKLCRSKNRQESRIKTAQCINCKEDFLTQEGKYCKKCLPLIWQENGCKAAASLTSQRRSKNEIEMGKLCSSYFVNVDFNKQTFGVWDADILLYDYKLAIHWNGVWHYKELGIEKVSLAQIQNRDKLKYQAIISNGWTNYIIKDLGKANPTKVQQEFSQLLAFLHLPCYTPGYEI